MSSALRLAFLATVALSTAPAYANADAADGASAERPASEPAASTDSEPSGSEKSATATSENAPSTASEKPASTDARPRVLVTKPPPSPVTLMVQYQRVGRAILDLQDLRGAHDCSDLMPRFRAIKLDQVLATPASRATAAVTLDELAAKVERMRGIRIAKACLDNPLAAECR